MKKLLLLTLLATTIHSFDITVQNYFISNRKQNIQLDIQFDPNEQILKQTLSVSVDNPHASIGQISITPVATKQYLPEFADSKEIFEKNTTVIVPVYIDTDQPLQTNLHVSFLLLPKNIMTEKIINVSFNESTFNESARDTNSISNSLITHHNYETTTNKKSFTESLQNLVQTTDSNWIRLFFAFLLGLLLSLTPCIYPMIPITIGILHSKGQKTLLYSFLGSCCYAFGISTMFACLGLLAAFAGASFGSLLSQPIFVLILVTFIGYMSLTMIEIIDLKIPAFLQRNTNMNSKMHPFISAYLFGLISGSVASPCVSPGLALLLTLVATMGNIFAGFLLLFCFGIGLSTPLIIIGTFSSSMNMIPRAGQWMVEIKKALGFLMLATCLYYLNNILSTFAIGFVIIAYLLFTALFYIIDAQKDFNTNTKTIKSLIGIILLALTVVIGFRTYDQMNQKNHGQVEQGVIWMQDYAQALDSAKNENKLILLDFWANHCTICKAIEKKIFQKNSVWLALTNRIIFVKVNCTHNTNTQASMLKNLFKVFAQPTILIIDPNTQEIVKKWSSEPYSMTPDEFIQAVQKLL
ncbi:thioredoxin family protein [Candidatus Babeliales bacterium]|nr:thioredoxin family protein [Candidatus Babeliales bacterium]